MSRSCETDFLYHYTSIESLALILKNRTIRLNPLDKMDDLQEQKTVDVDGMGKFVFVSCWTSNSRENIPMWKMYTQPTAGVRIKMRKRPFVSYDFPVNRLRAHIDRENADKAIKYDLPDKIYCDYNQLFNNNMSTPHFYGEDILCEVHYTSIQDELEPKVTSVENNRINFCLNTLGKNKNLYWSFQEESRYILQVFPFAISECIKDKERYNSYHYSLLFEGKLQPPFRFFDLDIDPRCFEEMEITCSPQMSIGNRILLEALVGRYNPKAKIIDSELLGKI